MNEHATLVALVAMLGPIAVAALRQWKPGLAGIGAVSWNALVSSVLYAVGCLAFGLAELSQAGVLGCIGEGLAVSAATSSVAGVVRKQAPTTSDPTTATS